MTFSSKPARILAMCALSIGGLAACGDDSGDGSEPKDAGSERDGDTAGTGMSRPTGGRGGAGGASGTAGQDAAYRCVPPPGDPGGPGGVRASCCGGLGACGTNPSGDAQPGLPHDTCSTRTDLRCVPNTLMMSGGDDDGGSAAAFATCRVAFPGAPNDAPTYEGRCVPGCFAQSSPVLGRLQQATCAQTELCAPCFSPLDGATTGICNLAGDAPTEPAPAGFPDCSDGLGYCVPQFAAGMSAEQLSRLTCAAGELCAPKIKVGNPGACFERCEAGTLGPGACVPSFLASGLSGFLMQGSCEPSELCAPCEVVNARTGVCD